MTTIVILTNSYPYYPGEEFLEEEIKIWHTASIFKLVLLPLKANGVPRETPPNVSTNLALASSGKVESLKFVINSLFSPFFFAEIFFLLRHNKFSFQTLGSAVFYTSKTLGLASKLEAFLKHEGPVDLVYCYWNTAQAYAACLLKKRGLIKKIVSRAHGYDLYEERRKNNYMPLKRQFVSLFDQVYALSSAAQKYLIDNYGYSPNQVNISPLGVSIPKLESHATSPNSFHIISVSSCIPVKRIDKIIKSLEQLAKRNKAIKIKWTHIGNGPLFKNLFHQAKTLFSKYPHITFEFKGHLPNIEVKNFFQSESIDAFINTSESEGIPVSIMESMSFGVPAIAPDTGGISSLINKNNGILLPHNPTIDEITQALSLMYLRSKENLIRKVARDTIKNKFNSYDNYHEFIRKLELLINTVPIN